MTKVQARKRFGQHFLTDEHYINRIVQAIDPHSEDLMVEIGPGMSALTQPLLARLPHLHVVEIDRNLVARLEASHQPDRLTVHACDALQFDFAQLGANLRVVGNLPYNISSPLLFHLLNAADRILDQHFMLQREVVERMVAEPGQADYSRLSVMLQYRYDMRQLFDVPPDAFDPSPRVHSAIVRMKPLPAGRRRANNEPVFFRLVAQAFSQRRKMLRKSLAGWRLDFQGAGVLETQRPEEISVEQFVALADQLAASDAAL